jgi:hypothetical protein
MKLENPVALTTTKPAEDSMRTEKLAAKTINPTDQATRKQSINQGTSMANETVMELMDDLSNSMEAAEASADMHQRQKAQASNDLTKN